MKQQSVVIKSNQYGLTVLLDKDGKPVVTAELTFMIG